MAKLSNTASTTTRRKSYLLSVTPVEYSLTEGTDIPAPDTAPPRSPAPDLAPPPTPGRGPLNSHPTTPPADEPSQMDTDSSSAREPHDEAPRSHFISSDGASTSPRSPPTQQQYSPQPRRPSGVRKLLSLSNLRNSFSSSRTSLAIPRSSHDTHNSAHPNAPSTYNPSLKRPSSPSMMSTTASSIAPSQHLSSPLQPQQPQPPLRTKKSGGNWFKRKSSLFLLNGNGELDAVAEDNSGGAYRPDTRESNKRVKPSSGAGAETAVYRVPERKPSPPPPMIPEIGRGSFSGGDLGWDEAAFRR